MRPIVEPDLGGVGLARWVAFGVPAVAAGARAVFGFPLRVGAIRLGALNLYRDSAGPLSADQHADALVMAGVAARAVLAMQAGGPPGELGTELEAGANLHGVVHQATGMVSAQLDVGVTDALIRLRAHASTNHLLLTAVAEDVVTRRLRFS